MIISVMADCHINKIAHKGTMDKNYPSLSFRTVDFMRSFKNLIDQNLNKINPDVLVMVGDEFDHFSPSNDVSKFFNIQVGRLSEAGIKTFILTGNHDVCKSNHALFPLQGLNIKNISVVDDSECVILEDKILAFFPYSLDIEQEEISLKDKFYKFLENIHDVKKQNGDKEIFFFGHIGVKGAVISEYETKDIENRKRKFRNSNQKDINFDDLEKIGAKYIFLGDYHRHQILPIKNCHAMYTGSIDRTDITQAEHEKGFVVYDDSVQLDKLYGKTKFVTNDKCRPMLEIKGNLSDIESALMSLNSTKYKGAIVKLNFVGKRDELIVFAANLDKYKSEIKNKIQAVVIYSEHTVTDRFIVNRDDVINDDLIKDGCVDSVLVLSVINEMIRDNVTDEHEINEIKRMAADIYAEANKEGGN